jgi:hypothetical protein
MNTKLRTAGSSSIAQDAKSVYKGSSFKPSAPQNATPPKPVIVPWQKKK